MTKKTPKEIEDKVIQLYRRGSFLKEIEKECSLNKSTIFKIMKRNNINFSEIKVNINTKCVKCGKIFLITDKFHKYRKFCSKKCRMKYNDRKWRTENPLKIKLKKRKYRLSKKGKLTEERYRETQKYKEYQRMWGKTEKAKERIKRYRLTEKGILTNKNCTTKYYSSEWGKFVNRENVKRRSHRERAVEGFYNREEWIKLRDETNGFCPFCKNYVGLNRLTVGHIIPIIKKGTNYLSNIIPMCKSCNCSVKDKDLVDWCDKKGYIVPKRVRNLYI